MNTIQIEPKLYNMAVLFAKQHNTNLQVMVENYIRKVVSKETTSNVIKNLEELSPEVQALVGIIPAEKEDYEDLNGERYKAEALKRKDV